ncbi:MAG: polyprenyl synthetase family protein [Kiritimatiellaeota bacterium]|nr:polyprenyl synthetase family protein [Kiritimatiellota bacterium]
MSDTSAIRAAAAVAPAHFRAPHEKIPQTRAERELFAQFISGFVKEWALVPPLPVSELLQLADKVIELTQVAPLYRDYIAILINNELWREALAAVPYERRLLLLPKCLRRQETCAAPLDEFGLLCQQCGGCSIQDLQSEAERLGYAVLVAEGAGVVMQLIQTGRVDAIPYMESAAIPGLAIPLLQCDCANTSVDLDWVWDAIHLTSADQTRRLDLTALQHEVETWFTPAALAQSMGAAEGHTEQLAHDWLARAGKRWRPFLAVSAFQALRTERAAALPDSIRKLAISVECYHKASLIHDDIEDGDETRYGAKTMHAQHGIPVALNVGDYLIGEGYRMIQECPLAPAVKDELLRVAVAGHRRLCRGQGRELAWARTPAPLTPAEVLDIFREKTAPAFEVALRLGALCSGGDYAAISAALGAYSEALGIAYQIRDDLDDFGAAAESNDLQGLRPSLLLALAYERARGGQQTLLDALWHRQPPAGLNAAQLQARFAELQADERAHQLLATHKEAAIRALRDLGNANLKGLLRRVIGKIFNDVEIKGWCHEFETRHATRSAPRAAAAG